MPIVQIDMLEGRDIEKKRALVRLVTEAVCGALDVKAESVRIILREMHPDHFGIGGQTAAERRSGKE